MLHWTGSLARTRRKPVGFIAPCRPILVDRVPTGPQWIHELKHDGYRLIARKDGEQVRLWTRHGHNWTSTFPRIAAATGALPIRSAMLDGEAVFQLEDGRPDFHALATTGGCKNAVFIAFDLLMVDGEDWRVHPLLDRKAQLAEILAAPAHGMLMSEHLEEDGETLLRHCSKFGLEGIVSKRKDSRYRSGHSQAWRKIRCPGYERS
jgi:bifunctional non-homologous end joining protein LigD